MHYEPTFIEQYLRYTEDTEPEAVLRKWVAIALVAACAERRLWVWYGSMRVGLHQYIMLAGPSGARKTTAIDDGVALLQGLSLAMSADSITRESLMLELQAARKETKVPGLEEVLVHNSLFAVAREFFAFFRHQDVDFLRWLVGIYDGKQGEWAYKTKHGEPCVLVNPCLNFLGATTPEGLGESIPQSAIGSGFTARIHFVHSQGRQKACTFPQADPALAKARSALRGHLNAILQRSGEIHWTNEAKQRYITWYSTFQVPSDVAPTVRSWWERMSNFVIRLSGVAVLADGRPSLRIEEKDVEWALQSLYSIADAMPRVFSTLGHSRMAAMQHELMENLRAAGPQGISRTEIALRHLPNLEPHQLNALLEELVRSKLIAAHHVAGTIYYTWIKDR